MPLSREDVAGIADYARIALSDTELDEMTAYMNDAIALLDPILAYDLDGVEPTFHPTGDLVNVVRDDVPSGGLPLEEALANAAARGRVSACRRSWRMGVRRDGGSLDTLSARQIATGVAAGDFSRHRGRPCRA